MAASLSGVYNLQVLTSTGAPAASYRLYTYTQGTTTHKVAYTNAAGTVAHTYTSDGVGGLYIALNSRGELPAPLFLTTGAYDLTLKDSAGASVWTRYANGAENSSSALLVDLASYTDAAKGAGLVGFAQSLSYAANTLGEYLKRIVADSTGKLTQPRFVGNNTDDSGTPDAVFRATRTLSSVGAGGGHGFRDDTASTGGTAGTGYAAFDAQHSISASGFDHIVGFQSRPVITGDPIHVYGYSHSPVFNGGANATNSYGLFAFNPTGAGTVQNVYGIYIPIQSKGSVSNYPIYVAQQGNASFIGSPLNVNNLLTVDPSAPLIMGGATTTNYPFIGYNYDPAADDKRVNDVAVTTKLDTNGMRVYVKTAGAPIGGAGMLATMTLGLQVDTAGAVYIPAAGTTASAANGYIDNASSNKLLRSTSSIRYKTDVRNLPSTYTAGLEKLRPVVYKSLAEADDKTIDWVGLIAEEVADVLPNLVHSDALGRPDGVQYDRLAVLLLAEVKELRWRLSKLEKAVK